MSRESAQLRAQIEILQQINAEARKGLEVDRRTMTGMLHALEAITQRLDWLPEILGRVESALEKSTTGRLLRTGEMAAMIGMHRETLRQKAKRGEIPAYQEVNGGSWLFDPEEVKEALTQAQTRNSSSPFSDEAVSWAAALAEGEDYDHFRDERAQIAHQEQIAKEMEVTR
jgi:excisionase family DNA binding protein